MVHGETAVEPTEKGTNSAPLNSPHINILVHPGLLTPDEAVLAAKNHIFLELSTRKEHSTTNAHSALIARRAGAKLLVNSDAHNDANFGPCHCSRCRLKRSTMSTGLNRKSPFADTKA